MRVSAAQTEIGAFRQSGDFIGSIAELVGGGRAGTIGAAAPFLLAGSDLAVGFADDIADNIFLIQNVCFHIHLC